MPDDHAIDARTVLDTGRANQHDRWSQGSGSAAERIGARIVVPEAARSFDASADDTFFAIGSCFARNVEERLEQAGAAVSSRRIAVEGLGHQAAREGGVFNKYTPLSILQELRWAAGTEPYPEAALLPAGDQLYDPYLSPKAERGDVATLMARRDQIRAYFAQAFEADIVVLTLGLIETWIDRETGLTLNDAPLPRLLARNPDRFAFRRLELEDCEAALEESLALLRAHGKAGQRVVITVSPVPLGRTFTGEDVIVANTLSKATLRVAAQRVIARHDGVDYFPSFEAVTMSDPELAWRGDRRHVGEFIVGRIIGTFLDRYGIAPKSASGDAAEDPALDDGQEADPKDALIGQLTRQVNRYKNGIILLQRDIRQMRAAEDDAKEAVVPKPGDNEDDSRQSALGRSISAFIGRMTDSDDEVTADETPDETEVERLNRENARYRAGIARLQQELTAARVKAEDAGRSERSKKKDGPSALAARTTEPATPENPGSVDFSTGADLGKGVVIDARAHRLDPQALTRSEMVQIRPYDKRNWGGPDHEKIPLNARITIQGIPRCRFPKAWVPETQGLPLLKGTYLWGGPLKVHFGHLLVDSVTRLYAYDRSRHDGVLFAFTEGVAMKPWVMPILNHFGLTEQDMVVIEEPTMVEALEVVAPGSALGQGPTEAYMDWVETLPRERRDPGTFPKDLYLGRMHIAHRGTLLGESYFSGLLEAAGFASFIPEEHGLEDQAAALEHAERVVFLEGSSVYSIELLRKSDATFYMIPRRRNSDGLFRPHIEPRGPFFGLGDDTSIQRMANRNGKIGPSSPSKCSDPGRLHADMVSHGLIADRPFDPEAFAAAVQADAEAYAAGNAELLEMVTDWIADTRPASDPDED